MLSTHNCQGWGDELDITIDEEQDETMLFSIMDVESRKIIGVETFFCPYCGKRPKEIKAVLGIKDGIKGFR